YREHPTYPRRRSRAYRVRSSCTASLSREGYSGSSALRQDHKATKQHPLDSLTQLEHRSSPWQRIQVFLSLDWLAPAAPPTAPAPRSPPSPSRLCSLPLQRRTDQQSFRAVDRDLSRTGRPAPTAIQRLCRGPWRYPRPTYRSKVRTLAGLRP